ncbi:DUF499 domain-containing protein [Embleya sp. NBC_00888]|uniref:DUF499 domain-containing protein n=1 Tax=Embleya sp. NBC_00888 TaxID=2975960 RepID=UPI003866BBC6|nr:DUF499 domain-containing protein [Embleya sp. NBC_00888]
MMPRYQHWADLLTLRKEITNAAGQITDLQMSLYSAVYSDRDVPYTDPGYYADITEPTVGLVRFMGSVARRLGTRGLGGKALFHLDQGMGGGKSHALVGLYHLANAAEAFLGTGLGQLIKTEAEQAGGSIDLSRARVVVLSADNMTPGATSPEFGPATNLYERFLWSLLRGDKDLYKRHLAEGPNKAALARALTAADGPVLILLDELMDYAMLLSDEKHIASAPGEKAFLSNLMDAVDEVDQVAFVVVMIRSDLDERGYTVESEDLRAYVATRLERNGITVSVTEAQDFSAIIRRRLFEMRDGLPTQVVAAEWSTRAQGTWQEQVFDRLGARRSLTGLEDRLAKSYPFSPDLMTLVREDWARHAGFQRVRSTVEIFASTAYHWMREHAAGRWAPDLIGVGDLPLQVVIESVLSSGLLHGNERAIQGYRQVAATDVVTKDGIHGRARELDELMAERGVDAGQPQPALRMATALFCYSLVPRAQAKRGATKPELLAGVYGPATGFQAAEEVFNALIHDDEGLGSLDVTGTTAGRGVPRYSLETIHNLRMFYKQARHAVQSVERDAYLWDRAKTLAQANQGYFDQIMPIARPDVTETPLVQIFGDVDQNSKTRLVVLDPRRWALHNGRDTPTRADVAALFGVGEQALPVDNAASCVVACVNTQRRDTVRKRATEVLAWRTVVNQLDPDDERRREAQAELRAAIERVDTDLLRAFQHFAYLTRTDRIEVDWQRFDDDAKSALKGGHVWDALVNHGRAVYPGKLSGDYVKTLLGKMPRQLTLKEIAQQFHKNPAFPMVPSADDIRHAIYQTLGGPEPYEVVDGKGTPLSISSADDLSIGSMDLSLRKAVAAPQVEPATPDMLGPTSGGDTRQGHNADLERPGQRTETTDDPTPTPVYRRYRLEVPNRSLADPEIRRNVANLLQAVLDVVDPETGGDLQLLDLQINLTADPAAVEEIEAHADEVRATWAEEELDF